MKHMRMLKFLSFIFVSIAIVVLTGCQQTTFENPPTPDPPAAGLALAVTYPGSGTTESVAAGSTIDLDAKLPAAERLNALTFTLKNETAGAILFTGLSAIGLVGEQANQFTAGRIDADPTQGLISGATFAFSIKFNSTTSDNLLKNCPVEITHNTSSKLKFKIACTSKKAGTVAYKLQGQNIWTVTPDVDNPQFSLTFTIVGGGGAGGRSSTSIGGGGGGAGQLTTNNITSANIAKNSLCTIIVGAGGVCNSASPNGKESSFKFSDPDLREYTISAYGGSAGNYLGTGGAGGNGIAALAGKTTISIVGGNGGANVLGGAGAGANKGTGGTATAATGAGGGGASASTTTIYYGGNGGCGQVAISWSSFVKP